MAENTNIEWATHTFNCWRGCTKVSAGCANCYAETMSGRNPKTLGVWGPNGTRVVAAEAAWKEPLKWDRKAAEVGERHRVFCASLADVFEDWTGPITAPSGSGFLHRTTDGWCICSEVDEPKAVRLDEVRSRLFSLIGETPNLDWLLLTKRPENILPLMAKATDEAFARRPYRNIWLGTSVEDRRYGLPRIDILREIPAAVRFLSVEPLLEDLGPLNLDGIDWVIVGGESGHGARPCDVAWIRSIVEQCKAAGTACFVKQLGATVDATVIVPHDGNYSSETQRLTLRDRKGGDMAEFPADLRIRQFPKTA